jgi:MFS family permease
MPDTQSAWSPLRRPLFRALWIATIVSNIGTWMHEVGAGWLMVTLDPRPVMVSLIQAAIALPIFFLAVPAGALADIVDRRRYLIATQWWMLGIALLLGVITLAGLANAWLLLLLTFALGIGAAMMTPAWAATVPELVARDELQPAVTLNSIGINIARAIGPALAGLIVTAAGPAAAFLLNALSFLGVIIVLARWQRAPAHSTLPAERFFGAMRAGLRYVWQAPQLQAVMVRAAAFFIFGTALWSLLPLIAQRTGGGAAAYGTLLACLGAGAVCGAFVLPGLRSRLTRDALVRAVTALFAAAMIAAGLATNIYVLGAAMLTGGLAWIGVLSSLHVAAQTSVPQWVRARALAIYLVAFAAGTAAGAALWGAVAGRIGVPFALVAAAAGALLAIPLTWRVSLGGMAAEDTRRIPWPEPQTHGSVQPERGPVMVTVEYGIDPQRAREFAQAMEEQARVRRRDGATSWGLFSDVAEPGRYVEVFFVESWAEHMRQHHRITRADEEIQERVRGYHIGAEPPRVSHLLAEID